MATNKNCYYFNKPEVIKSLNTLRNKSSPDLQKLIDEEIFSLQNEFHSKRSKKGGSSKLCAALTIAILMGGSVGASYASYILSKRYVIGRVLAPLCSTKTDQVTSYLLSFMNPSSSCLARQQAWDNFRQYTLSSVSIMSLIHGTMNYYKKIHDKLTPICNFVSQGCLSSANVTATKLKYNFKKLRNTLGKRKIAEKETEEFVEIFNTPPTSQSSRKSSTRSAASSSPSVSLSSQPRISIEVKELLSDVYQASPSSQTPKEPRSMVYEKSHSKDRSTPTGGKRKSYRNKKGGKRKSRKLNRK